MRLRTRAIIVNFGGIGNGAMTMPILIYLIKNNIYQKIFHTENPIIKDRRFLILNNLQSRVSVIDSAWRKFNYKDWADINYFLRHNSINTIYNFRNEAVENYYNFRKDYPGYNYFDINYDGLINRKTKNKIAYDIFHLFENVGFKNKKDTAEWLSRFKTRSDKESIRIGFMVSASQVNKEYPTEGWIELANLILSHNKNVKIIIFHGISDREMGVAKLIATSVNNENCCLISDLDLFYVIKIIGELDCFVSNDTGLLHISAAIGVPGIGVFIATDPDIWGANFFVPSVFLKSSFVGKCNLWKSCAGTCGHFYEVCPEYLKQDILAKNIHSSIINLLNIN